MLLPPGFAGDPSAPASATSPAVRMNRQTTSGLCIGAPNEDSARQTNEMLRFGLDPQERAIVTLAKAPFPYANLYEVRVDNPPPKSSGNLRRILSLIALTAGCKVVLSLIGSRVGIQAKVPIWHRGSFTLVPVEAAYGASLQLERNGDQGLWGYSLPPLPSKPIHKRLYSTSRSFELYVLADQPDDEIAATIHHEVAHAARYWKNRASWLHPQSDPETDAAEREAKFNFAR